MSLATADKQIQTRMIGTSFDTEQSQHAVEDVIVAVGYVPMALQSRQINLLLGEKTIGRPEQHGHTGLFGWRDSVGQPVQVNTIFTK